MSNELKQLKAISKYAGERFDLVQAGGGNSSVKLQNGEMLIKASGYSLSDVNEQQGYSTVLTKEIASIVSNKAVLETTDKRERETLTADLVRKSTLDQKNRPSIETLLHSLLYKYTLHTHPVIANSLLNQKNWKEILQSIFENESIAYVDYFTPGVDLAIALHNEVSKFNSIPKIIFLQNHGVIVSSDNYEEIYTLKEMVISKIESFLNVDFSTYKNTTAISALFSDLEDNNNITYLTEDTQIIQSVKENLSSFTTTPFCPDSLVYCGFKSIILKDLNDSSAIANYKQEYFELPKIVIFNNNVFIRAINIKKAKEIEEVLKFNCLAIKFSPNNPQLLKNEELGYLSNWEAEKFRQEL